MKQISIEELKKDFHGLGKFKNEDLEKPLEYIPLNADESYHDIWMMIVNSGYIKWVDTSDKKEKMVYYDGSDVPTTATFRIADFIAAYEFKMNEDNLYNLMHESLITPDDKAIIFEYLRAMSDGVYFSEVIEEHKNACKLATINQIKSLSKAAAEYGIAFDDVISVVKESYKGV